MKRVMLLLCLVAALFVSASTATASNIEPGSGPGGCTPGQVIRIYPGGPLYVCPSATQASFLANPSADYNQDPGSGQWYWFRRDYSPCGPPWCPWCAVIYDAYADPYQWYYITSRCAP